MTRDVGSFTYAPGGAPQPPAETGPHDPDPAMPVEVATGLAQQLAAVLAKANTALTGGGESPSLRAISDHLGIGAFDAAVIEDHWPTWGHLSAQHAVDAYLAEFGISGEWFGLSVPHQQHQDLASVLGQEPMSSRRTLPAPGYTVVATGPDTTERVISLGLARTQSADGVPIVLVLRATQRFGPGGEVSVEVLAADPDVADAALGRVRDLVNENDALKGKVLSFGMSENYGNELVTFLPRPDVAADDVILPTGVLDEIVGHIAGIAERAERLTALGVHLKRGLLLYGAPGTGKTHTVRHLIGRLTDSTVIVLTGTSLQFIGRAAVLARKLAPAIVVCEDVDLIAQDRSLSPEGNPLLFTLLDAMDGVASDADVTFVLTTNRAADLEHALVQRPGRVDLAVEIPRPDQAGRVALLRLYARGARVEADLDAAAARLGGATASAMKEIMRRAVLAALDAGDDPVVTEPVLAGVVEHYLSDASALTRSLLGTDEPPVSGLDGPATFDDTDFGPGFGPGRFATPR